MQRMTPQTIVDTIRGDLEAFSSMLESEHAEISASVSQLGELMLTTTAVRRVLLLMLHGQATPQLVQNWASFIRRGYIADADGQTMKTSRPIDPIDIEYEPLYEACISEVISRLDELGDVIDGEISRDELVSMLQKLPYVE